MICFYTENFLYYFLKKSCYIATVKFFFFFSELGPFDVSRRIDHLFHYLTVSPIPAGW
jgi:hypothetical protein